MMAKTTIAAICVAVELCPVMRSCSAVIRGARQAAHRADREG
jgi:hypothetical protein